MAEKDTTGISVVDQLEALTTRGLIEYVRELSPGDRDDHHFVARLFHAMKHRLEQGLEPVPLTTADRNRLIEIALREAGK